MCLFHQFSQTPCPINLSLQPCWCPDEPWAAAVAVEAAFAAVDAAAAPGLSSDAADRAGQHRCSSAVAVCLATLCQPTFSLLAVFLVTLCQPSFSAVLLPWNEAGHNTNVENMRSWFSVCYRDKRHPVLLGSVLSVWFCTGRKQLQGACRVSQAQGPGGHDRALQGCAPPHAPPSPGGGSPPGEGGA